MRLVRIVALATATLLGAAALAGCSSEEPKSCDQSHPLHLGLVYGATANSAAPELTSQVSKLLDQAAASNGTVTIVTPSGAPSITGPIPLGSAAHDGAICSDDQARAVVATKQALARSVAKTAEVDLLTAISDAAAIDAGSRLGVVVVGSGLQTTGTLDFTKNGLLYGDPDAIASQMAAKKELPAALKGLNVYWSGMSDVAGRQTPLSESAAQNLQAIWTALIAKAGGRLVPLSEHLAKAPRAELPSVTPVSIRTVPLTPDWAAPLTLSDAQLHFKGDSAELVDPAGAKALLRKVAASIADTRIHVTVTGATSGRGGTSQAADVDLSKRRAGTVIDLLAALGAPRALLKQAGVGHEWCGFQREVAGGGKTADQIAAGNRRVVLTADGVGLCA